MDETPGLSTALGITALVADYWDELDADFTRFYRLDLERCCFGEDHVGLRRLKGLITGLPPESALARAMGWSWSNADEMTATLVELAHDQATSARTLISAFTGKRYRGPKDPFTWPRPEMPNLREPATPPASLNTMRDALLRG